MKKSLYFKHILKLAMEVLGKYKRYFYQTQGCSLNSGVQHVALILLLEISEYVCLLFYV